MVFRAESKRKSSVMTPMLEVLDIRREGEVKMVRAA